MASISGIFLVTPRRDGYYLFSRDEWPMRKQDKATGWKVPLIFCCVILACVCVGYLFRPSMEIIVPALPESLVEKARDTRIELSDQDPDKWKDRLVSASGGFVSAVEKDRKLSSLIGNALAARRFDVACRSAVFMSDGALREDMLGTILDKATERCDDLYWGVFAIHGSHDRSKAEKMAKILWENWEKCDKSGN